MLLIDTQTSEGSPRSYFLTRMEFKKLYPLTLQSKLNYIFKHKIPKEVPDGEAKILMKKYPHIIKFEDKVTTYTSNRHQELAKIKYTELKKIGGKLGLPFKQLAVKTEILIDNIVNAEAEKARMEAKAKALKGK